jgi:hypothetical protein
MLKVELSIYYLTAITRPLTIGAVWTPPANNAITRR